MIEAWCPSCGKTVAADKEDLGELMLCEACGNECYVPSQRVQPGAMFGRFEVVRPLGLGASAEVHLALDTRSGEEVALKLVFADAVENEVDLQRFLRESRNATDLDHPGIVQISETGCQDNCYYLAMEYVDGETLDRLLDKHGAFAETDAWLIARDVSLALDYAWEEKRLLHRDIKPANIILAYTGTAKLMDLGIAKSLLPDVTQLTDPDTIVGTPFYMSPEQCAPGKLIDFRADMYSLGATVYHLLTGEPPFGGTSTMDVLRQHLFAPVPNPHLINPAVSKEGVQLLFRMMAKRTADRHESWRALAASIQNLLEAIG